VFCYANCAVMFATLRSGWSADSRESVLTDCIYIHISDLLSNVWNWKVYPHISEPEVLHICGNSNIELKPLCDPWVLMWFDLTIFSCVLRSAVRCEVVNRLLERLKVYLPYPTQYVIITLQKSKIIFEKLVALCFSSSLSALIKNSCLISLHNVR
jgi:hypothetical protein